MEPRIAVPPTSTPDPNNNQKGKVSTIPIIGESGKTKPKKPKPVKVVIKNPQANTAEVAAANFNDPNERTGLGNLQKTGPGTNYKNVSSTSFDNPQKSGGGKKSGGTSDTVGPWESGQLGKWQTGFEGRWKSGSDNGSGGDNGKNWYQQGSRPSDTVGGARNAGQRQVDEYRSGAGFAGVQDPLGVESGGGAGGGGTGSPLLGVSSALKATGLKTTSEIAGKSVEEAVKGARRTKKTGQKRSQ
jgi:hypothetical protein